jgi:hypothetical protein
MNGRIDDWHTCQIPCIKFHNILRCTHVAIGGDCSIDGRFLDSAGCVSICQPANCSIHNVTATPRLGVRDRSALHPKLRNIENLGSQVISFTSVERRTGYLSSPRCSLGAMSKDSNLHTSPCLPSTLLVCNRTGADLCRIKSGWFSLIFFRPKLTIFITLLFINIFM